MELQNIDVETRVWPWLQTVEGTTLELAPGEIADVAVSEPPDDPFLRPVAATGKAKGRTTRAKGGKAASGPQNAPRGVSDVDPTAGSSDPSGNDEPDEADASGKEEA